MEKITFLDLETTGLEDNRDFILEVGVLQVDAKTLEQRWCANWPIYNTRQIRFDNDRVRIPTSLLIGKSEVMQMHTDNGLIAECDGPYAVSLEAAEQLLLEKLALAEGERVVLGGFSPQFDRDFIRYNMHRLHSVLSHRMVDVSTFRECHLAWLGGEKGTPAHRAMADCVAALNELRVYRERALAYRERALTEAAAR